MADRVTRIDKDNPNGKEGTKSKPSSREGSPDKLAGHRRGKERMDELRASSAAIVEDWKRPSQENIDDSGLKKDLESLKTEAYEELNGDISGNEQAIGVYEQALIKIFREVDGSGGERERYITNELIALQKHEKFQEWKLQGLKTEAYKELNGDISGNEQAIGVYGQALIKIFREIDGSGGERERYITNELTALQKHEKFQEWKELSKLQKEIRPLRTKAYEVLNIDIPETGDSVKEHMVKAVKEYMQVLQEFAEKDGVAGKVFTREWLVLQSNEKFRRWEFSRRQEGIRDLKTEAYGAIDSNLSGNRGKIKKYEQGLLKRIDKAKAADNIVDEEFFKEELVALLEACENSGTHLPEAIKSGQKSATAESSGLLDHLSHLSHEELKVYEECMKIADTIETFTIVNDNAIETFTIENDETAKIYEDKKRIMDELRRNISINQKEAKTEGKSTIEERGSGYISKSIEDAKKDFRDLRDKFDKYKSEIRLLQMELRMEVNDFTQKLAKEYRESLSPITELMDTIDRAVLEKQDEQAKWDDLMNTSLEEMKKAGEESEEEIRKYRKILNEDTKKSILNNSHITNMKAELRNAIDQYKANVEESYAKLGRATSEYKQAFQDFLQSLEQG